MPHFRVWHDVYYATDAGETESKGGSDVAMEELSLQYEGFERGEVFVKSWSTSGDADDRPTEEVADSGIFVLFGDFDGDGEADDAAVLDFALTGDEGEYDAAEPATEEVSFYFNKIAFNYAKTDDGKGGDPAGEEEHYFSITLEDATIADVSHEELVIAHEHIERFIESGDFGDLLGA